MTKKLLFDKFILIFLGIAVLILWQMLLPGYVLTLDMVFTPETKVVFSETGYNNSLPISYLIHFLNILIPSWIIQKIILFILFFSLGYLSFKFLPLPKNKTVRLFSALVYTLNPFVYSRFLAGHYGHLMAYALLPVFIHFLFKFTESPSFKISLKLFASILLISLFSLHFFAMTVMIMVFWFLFHFIKYLARNNLTLLKLTLKNLIFGGLLFAVVSAYWLIPTMNRNQPFEQRFDIKHWQAFAASNHDKINTTLNVLSLNGFWGEGQPWSKQFAWPQGYIVFWIAFGLIGLLILAGLINGFKNKKTRPVIIFFSILGFFAFIFSTGAGETIFKNFNLWFYKNISFWSGFRDSQKFTGFLALSYAVLSGFGVMAIVDFLNKKKKDLTNNLNSLIFLIPILFGFLMWGGFQKQIKPVWYPEVWNQAKNVIQVDGSNYKVLFLPWHGYLSLNFNNNLLVANPASNFFGEKAVVSKSVEIKEIYDQELSPEYINVDKVVRDGFYLAPDETINFFVKQNIKYIVYFQDLKGVDNLRYEFLTSDRLKKIIVDKQLIMSEIEAD
ncbi:MAG: hypothetical protein NT012_03605 [Candidatus Nealsonbacteria bacterium]|nr:hypothetical protein [Candidatus Nealsonbacteria bacterium]